MNMAFRGAIVALSLSMGGCATWSTSSVENAPSGPPKDAAPVRSLAPAQVMLTDADVSDRRYTSLGDINVTVNKTTVFHPNPTEAMVNDKLREKAAELGADAVILVRYGKGGVSLWSWGSLEGKGRAIKYLP